MNGSSRRTTSGWAAPWSKSMASVTSSMAWSPISAIWYRSASTQSSRDLRASRSCSGAVQASALRRRASPPSPARGTPVCTPRTLRGGSGGPVGLPAGEVGLPLPEPFLGAAPAPVAGHRDLFAGQSALAEQVRPQLVHDLLRLAVGEHVHAPGGPVQRLHGGRQRALAAPGAAVDEHQLALGRDGQVGLVGGR